MTIIATTATAATRYGHQRKVVRDTSSGRLWVALYDSTAFEFWYSDDAGASWTDAAQNVTADSAVDADMFCDLDGHLHFAYVRSGGVKYRRGDTSSSLSWSSEVTSLAGEHPSVVAHRIVGSSGWKAHIAAVDGGKLVYHRLNVTSGGTVTVDTSGIEVASVSGTDNNPSLDFNHTGDGVTVAGSAPHLYLGWSDSGIKFVKAGYSGGSWSFGAVRTLDAGSSAASGRLCGHFDGTRFVIVYADSTATTTAKVRERDAADTSTTSLTPPALSDGVITALAATYDGDEDIRLYAVGDTSDDVSAVVYDRSAGSWGSWGVEATASATVDTLTVKRAAGGARVDFVYTDGSTNVIHDSTAINRAPTAATWDITDNQAHDVAESLTLDWTFSDPDAGDTQGSYALRRQIGAGAYSYWNAGTTSWGGGEVQNTSSTTQVALSSSWGSDGDSNHKYAVKTWDAAGLVGSYSSDLTVIPSAKDNPTISSPADAGTVTAPSVTVSWTASTQTAYKARLLTSASAEIETSGWVTSTATSHAFSATLANSTSYKVEVTTKNDEGLASDADTNSFSVSFTPPSTPTLTATASDTNGYITVAITNLGAGATEASNDVFVRVASGGRADIDRPVGGDGIRIATGVAVDGSFVDRAVASGVDYEYLVRCYADTGATADSAWT